MSKVDDGGPAFPVPDGEAANLGYHGLSIRDWFAGQALAHASRDFWASSDFEHIAERAYALADAMLAARKGDAS